ncbi:uncharacterized protein LOC142224832 [Haematobia irritans]|uniref:uncharacterized protein LOC142224832 n=1 Tax=Haematobia irritans TaxID=7368 RepID=UPI003F501609
MVKILAKHGNGLKVCHLNAQSLRNKIDEFRFIFEDSGIDIVCISETWLSDSIPDSLVRLSGYVIYRNDRKRRGGGVAIYIRDNLVSRFCAQSARDDPIEMISIEIEAPGCKVFVACVYRPRNDVMIDSFLADMQTITVQYKNIIITGDFNSNILTENRLSDEMLSLGLYPTNTTVPTHHTSAGGTLLDMFFVSDINYVILYDQISAPTFSKHDLIFLWYDVQMRRVERGFSFRDFRNIDFGNLYSQSDLIDWSQIYVMDNVDEQISFLQNNIVYLYELCVPVRTLVTRPRSLPWFTNDIRRAIDARDLLYSRWKRFRTATLHDEFREARRRVNSLIKHAKSVFKRLS